MNPKSWDFTLCQALRYSIDRGKHSVSKKLEGNKYQEDTGRVAGVRERKSVGKKTAWQVVFV